ncbi:MAG TPA: GNAT family N-acetyltransferase [Sphingomicrobium sp.]|nr:GNAT family N-acetyltransferase [Sphingomicrobium sp.]
MTQIREVAPGDAEQIAGIYSHHVLNGTASYEVEPPSVEATAAKIERITGRGWPFLVACEAEEVVGYAYAEQLRDRPAYRFTCENSIYIRVDRMGRGIGKALLTELCARCESLGFRQMIAVIGGAEPASIALHERCGFGIAGRLGSVGWKKGRWLDTVYMQRALGAGADITPSDI